MLTLACAVIAPSSIESFNANSQHGLRGCFRLIVCVAQHLFFGMDVLMFAISIVEVFNVNSQHGLR